jgi:hypothetical protein
VDKILRGATPAEWPVEKSRTLELVVHLQTAQPIDRTVTPEMWSQADNVIKWPGSERGKESGTVSPGLYASTGPNIRG